MKKPLLLIPLFIWVCAINAQQVNTSGGHTNENEFSAEWIIGGSLIDNSILSISDANKTAMTELSYIDSIDVYPTNTQDFLTIAIKTNTVPMINYTISNGTGIACKNGIFNQSSPFNLDVTSLAAGYYIIIFSSPDDKTFLVSKKFIKL